MKRLAAEWATFRERCVPVDASVTKVQESRRCFYGGAAALLSLLSLDAVHGGFDESTSEPTDDDMAKMTDLACELAEFSIDVAQGRA